MCDKGTDFGCKTRDRRAFFKYSIHTKRVINKAIKRLYTKRTEKNLEKLVIFKAGIICVKVGIEELFQVQNHYNKLFEKH